ncbi:hypothetical protein MMC06_000605 [Schaereria dolodes]|nr:hypothetical protein [Schaereria dolodes]
MPLIPLHPPAGDINGSNHLNPLPQILQTPSGLAILEIQGTLNIPAVEPLDPRNIMDTSESSDTPIGHLVFPDYNHADPESNTGWMKRVYLYVGRYQRLTGEVKKLTNPMAVIRKKNHDGDMSHKVIDEELEIIDIVYHKILFSSRPEPVGN